MGPQEIIARSLDSAAVLQTGAVIYRHTITRQATAWWSPQQNLELIKICPLQRCTWCNLHHVSLSWKCWESLLITVVCSSLHPQTTLYHMNVAFIMNASRMLWRASWSDMNAFDEPNYRIKNAGLFHHYRFSSCRCIVTCKPGWWMVL